MDDDSRSAKGAGLAEEVASLRALAARLWAENARLLRLLELTPKEAVPPGPAQTGFFEAPPALHATLKHAASMLKPLFYERRRSRMSTWDTPRFLYSYDETLDGGLILPRGLAESVRSLVELAGSRIDVVDSRSTGTVQEYMFQATLTDLQQEAPDALRGHDLGVLVAPPGAERLR